MPETTSTTCCHLRVFPLSWYTSASSPHLHSSYAREISIFLSGPARRSASLFNAPDPPRPPFETPHYLAHLEGWGGVADLSPPLGLVNLSDLHDPSWIILTIYWPYHNLLVYQSLLRPTSSSLPASCAPLILHYQVPLLFPPFIGCSAPFSLLSLPSDLHFYLSPIGCSFCPSSSSTPALHSLASFTLLTCSSASLLAPSNSHPYLSSSSLCTIHF